MKRMNRNELADYIRSIDAAQYAQQRNYLGGSTRLSEYITRGAISLPQVRALLLETNTQSASYKLINELSWREYWQLVWRVRGNDIFEYIRPVTVTLRPGLPEAVLSATTGIHALDAGIHQLIVTGYIDNHMRMWLAGLVCNIARCDWKTGADWMHSYLIDGDFASNHLSWQWVAGSYTGKVYLPQQDNINTYTKSSQHQSYLDQPYSVIDSMPVPHELLAITQMLPKHTSQLPSDTITLSELKNAPEILLYSPWTLDTQWRQDSTAVKILLIDQNMFGGGKYSQNVIDSIMWFMSEIPNIKLLCAVPADLVPISARLIRKDYPAINDWPGKVDKPDKLYQNVVEKFYPSFSAFWKQVQKSE